MKRLALAIVVAVAACGGDSDDGARSQAELIEEGDRLFHGSATCAVCHGPQLEGTSMGPSFLDPVYAPGHHPDEAFFRAVENGVQPHHWDFGPMPALTHLDRDDVEAIVAYVRSVQVANGID